MSGFFYILKNYWGSQRLLDKMRYVFWYLPKIKTKEVVKHGESTSSYHLSHQSEDITCHITSENACVKMRAKKSNNILIFVWT